MRTAQFVEDFGGRAARYKLSEPWNGHWYVAVAPLTMDGKKVTRIIATKETGPVTACVLHEVEGHQSGSYALGTVGWRVT